MFLFTQERATLSNGALANSKIINSSRSAQANIFNLMKFPIDTSYEKFVLFHQALEQYVRNRPREWVALLTFRQFSVDVAQGFVEYIMVARHRLNWFDYGELQESRSRIATFMLELSKKLDIRYVAPPLPVNLSVGASARQALTMVNPEDEQRVTADAMSPAPNADLLQYSPSIRGLQEKFAPKD